MNIVLLLGLLANEYTVKYAAHLRKITRYNPTRGGKFMAGTQS